MENKYTYKKQGDDTDSWLCEEPNGNKYMVYEDPFKEKKMDIYNIDIDSLSDEQLIKLAERLKRLI